jgi:hypothetical protein
MRLLTALLALCLCSSFALAQAEDARLRDDIGAMLGKWDKACKAGDVKTQIAMLTPDFHQIDLQGKVEDKAAVIGPYRRRRHDLSDYQYSPQAGAASGNQW